MPNRYLYAIYYYIEKNEHGKNAYCSVRNDITHFLTYNIFLYNIYIYKLYIIQK